MKLCVLNLQSPQYRWGSVYYGVYRLVHCASYVFHLYSSDCKLISWASFVFHLYCGNCRMIHRASLVFHMYCHGCRWIRWAPFVYHLYCGYYSFNTLIVCRIVMSSVIFFLEKVSRSSIHIMTAGIISFERCYKWLSKTQK